MPHTVGCTGSAIAIEAKTLFIEDGLEEFALPLRKNEVSGFGHAPLFASSCGGHERFTGRVHAINARRAKPLRSRSKGRTAPGILLYSPSIPDCGPTKHGAFSSGMSRWLTTKDKVVQLFRFPVESLLLRLLMLCIHITGIRTRYSWIFPAVDLGD